MSAREHLRAMAQERDSASACYARGDSAGALMHLAAFADCVQRWAEASETRAHHQEIAINELEKRIAALEAEGSWP